MQHISINGISAGHLSVMDRGLHYGDGLFETIACVDGALQFWDEHIERMRGGAARLGIELPAIENFKDDVCVLLDKNTITNGIVKLILTRGESERGYRSPSPQKTTRIVVISDLPEYPDEFKTQGIKACFCQHPVSKNTALAGIKHLNRLDNVIARNEWHDEYQEGLMLDDSEHVIEGTMSNVFFVKNGELYTPSLKFSGVEGVIRGQILSIADELGINTRIAEIKKEDVKDMDEIFVCNSIIGLWPVSALAENNYQLGSVTQKISTALQQRMGAQ
ncbi:MAG: aminodeoxychorismate lyase [Gammaproteobacteria bacterium]|nr:aminodeoxychorismate lyase [Gammaproteobacteria bacterium]